MKYLFIALLMSSLAHAEKYMISGELINFKNHNGLLVKGCEKKCQALTVVEKHKKIDLKKAREKETFVGSVGSDVCRLVYKTNSIIGIAENKDQRAFCVFKDNSLIEINSLSQYLTEKKIVKE